MNATMPGYVNFVRLFFIQPLTLHERLKACGVAEPGMSGWKLWQQRHQLHENYRTYILRLSVIFMLPIGAWLVLVMVTNVFDLSLPLAKMATYVLVSMVLSVVAGVWGGVALGATLALASGATLGVALGVSLGWALGVAAGVAAGVVAGVALGVASGVATGIVVDVADVVATGVAGGVTVGLAAGVTFGVAAGEAAGVVFGAAVIAAFLQLHFYLIEMPLQLLLSIGNHPHISRLLAFSPVLFHEPIYFPLPRLTSHIVAAAGHEPSLAQRVIQAANRSPGTRNAASHALAQLVASDLGTLLIAQDFDAINNLRGFWLPGPDTDNPLLRAIAETARFMLAANSAASPYIALQHLNDAQIRLQSLEKLLLASKDPLARYLPPFLAQWQHQLAATRETTQAKAATLLPNPFSAGNPLSPEMRWGRDIFRGREDIIHDIELLLADRHNSTSIALIGPRRCGKSSLLKMLPVLLPDTVVVEFNLQGEPCDTPAAFYQALAATAHKQALHHRRLRLPSLPAEATGTPIERLKQWFQQLETFTQAPRILICIDEFERIERLFPEQGRELDQFMGLLRATIQDCRRLRLLVAGTASFDDLGKIWTDNFINLRELRVGYLPHPAAMGLLQHPIQPDPFDAISPEVAQAIFQRTQGQPFLTQAFAHVLVNLLNQTKRKTATLDDIDPTEAKVLRDFKYYFANAWDETPNEIRPVLMALAQAQNKPAAAQEISQNCDKPTRRWLRRRLWIDETGQLQVPAFGRWLQEWEDRE